MIQIDLRLFDKVEDLTLSEYLLLCVLYEDTKYYELISITEEIILERLEVHEYIRIIDGVCVMDTKAIQVFESNPLVKQAKEILEYMNELKRNISKKPFSYATHGKDIIHRLGEKQVTVQEIKEMLEFKYKEWTGTDYQMYLRPSTLFNKTKFYNYIEQAEMGKNKIDIKQSKMDDDE
jgi:uncharacterized phage protein (TIGR02220 family)